MFLFRKEAQRGWGVPDYQSHLNSSGYPYSKSHRLSVFSYFNFHTRGLVRL